MAFLLADNANHRIGRDGRKCRVVGQIDNRQTGEVLNFLDGKVVIGRFLGRVCGVRETTSDR